jgi:hypothetical protein
VKYEWIVVGGGIAGIAVAEILAREGHRVLLLDRAAKLAGGTTRDLHEWIHTGCLYTLVPDRLLTLKYMLGGIDDLLEYYASFPRMNLVPGEQGLRVEGLGWFNDEYIHFKYRRRPFNPVWSLITARSMYLVERIAGHDWLRRRAGIIEEFRGDRLRSIGGNLREIWRARGRLLTRKTTDLTSDSRAVLRDLVAAGMANGLAVSTGQNVHEIREQGGMQAVITDRETLLAERVILCAGRNIADFVNVAVSTSYAPMAVVDGIGPDAVSYVELDYHVRNCINLIVKGGGIGLAGGISLPKREDCDTYLDYVIERHREHHPDLRVLGRYVGLKNEITFPGQDRNYQFHIVNCRPGVWAAIPGKFTLGFSLAPEFYRRIYRRNPRKHFPAAADAGQATDLVADTHWQELARDRTAAGGQPAERSAAHSASESPDAGFPTSAVAR